MDGEGTIDTYTVVYSRERLPIRTILLGTDDEGQRFVANTPADSAVFEQFVTENQIGKRVRVESNADGLNIATPV